ncbi:hypothetical protein [Nitrosospira sp. Nsp13]|uniref:hypothetical protein n=1 Tax=Nitrosospira sp. Nsp13 TaxID=1855332 RepID=UPI0008902DF1|nr:hypothetical protein [Nitrosospira sp. Nsp13]SCY62217.1 hypothetical protein SAMN05216308_1305 [Nitrosospira sp. Nsp13]
MATLVGKAEERLIKKVPSARGILILLVLIVSSIPNTYAEGVDRATPSGCHARAKYYEEMTRNLKAKAEEQEQLLEHYEDKSYLYGKRAQDLQAHTRAMIRKYQRDSMESLNKATDHRYIGCELDKNENFSSPRKDELTSMRR